VNYCLRKDVHGRKDANQKNAEQSRAGSTAHDVELLQFNQLILSVRVARRRSGEISERVQTVPNAYLKSASEHNSRSQEEQATPTTQQFIVVLRDVSIFS
jgi:hypothetical protein